MSLRHALLAAFLLVATSACRTYGGHGSEQATLAGIADMTAWADAEIGRLGADAAAAEEASLTDVADRLRALAQRLGATREAWATRAASLGEGSGHRTIRRALMGMISERQLHEDAYTRLAESVAPVPGIEAARYQVAPAFYARIASRLDARRIRDVTQAR